MLKQDFMKLLKMRLTNRKDSDIDTIIELEATQIQNMEIERCTEFTPWFLESEWGEASTEAGEERLPLPTKFIAEVEDQVMQVQVDGVWQNLRKDRYDELLVEFPYEQTSVPKAYDISGSYIVFKPTPNAAYPIRMRCYLTSQPFNTLQGTEDNVVLQYASDWLMAATGRVIAAQHLRDAELAQMFQVQIDEAKRRIWFETEQRDNSNRSYRMEG